ncbi:MAG TPA: WYL domain-containing protein, partial [Phototrophicaceae bacterium]|nr:WYL domain-containing protein [Phototrophicaceae bacterium]
LVDLSPEAAQGVAFLQATFQTNTPMSAEVNLFLLAVLNLLPQERRDEIVQQRKLLEIDLRPRDQDAISPEVWDIIELACDSRRKLAFDYYSPSHSDGLPRHNLVEPERYFFDPVRSHYYLEAFCLEVRGPRHTWLREESVIYRLGRIRNPQVLPTHFVPRRHHPRTYELNYHLAPEIARNGITEHFPESSVTYLPDGSAEVEARVTNLFMALRTLLHYGPSCQVTGGTEAVTEMQALVKALHNLYSSTNP